MKTTGGLFILILILIQYHTTSAFNCQSLIQSSGDGNGTSNGGEQFVPELQGADLKELISCLATAGQNPIPQEQANSIWIAVKKVLLLLLH